MPDFLLTVAVIWGIAAITPGPNFFFIVRCALTRARRTAMSAVAGIVTGTLCWGMAGWLGVSALFIAVPMAYAALKIAGSLYLIWLGLRLLWKLRLPRSEEEPRAASASNLVAAWRSGLMTNLANPKTAVFVASLFSATLPSEHSWSDGLLVIAVMIAISGAWYGAVALTLGGVDMVRGYRRFRRWIDAVAGMAFVGFGMKLALSGRDGSGDPY
jgi:threonine/homoserine/homoserine lactone efflux protein